MVDNRTTENFWKLLRDIGRMYGDRYDKNGDLDDLRKALTYGEQTVRWKLQRIPLRAQVCGSTSSARRRSQTNCRVGDVDPVGR